MVIFSPGIQSYPRNILGLAARRIIIETTKNEEDAIRILKKKYENEEVVLNEENYITTEFDVIERMKIKDYQTR